MADFTLKQNDTSPALEAILRSHEGKIVNLTAASVRFHMTTERYNVKIDDDAVIVDAEGGKVRYNWKAGDTDEHGSFYAEWEVTYSDGTVETFPNSENLSIRIQRSLA